MEIETANRKMNGTIEGKMREEVNGLGTKTERTIKRGMKTSARQIIRAGFAESNRTLARSFPYLFLVFGGTGAREEG